MDITAATREYESWLAQHTPLHQPDIDYKHEQMAKAFPFFRGTYYRWVQQWSQAAGDLAGAPAVLAVGDLHVENFGTWRDSDGRLCWGVNDFDEADQLPYTNDLVRLAASVRSARRAGGPKIKFGAACKAILSGYRDALQSGGTPFVLEERHPELRALAMAKDRDPRPFWKRLTTLLDDAPVELPETARQALAHDMPVNSVPTQFRFRPQVGMGSLGKPRYVALAECVGGWMAREAKAATPPATAWASGRTDGRPHTAEAARRAVRSPDPFYGVVRGWVVRRLGPRCSRMDLAHLEQAEDTDCLLHAMGAETANVHLGTPEAGRAILEDLARRPKGWLAEAAREMADRIDEDRALWRESQR
jgi:uncharacterized protein (DUF2252 family)